MACKNSHFNEVDTGKEDDLRQFSGEEKYMSELVWEGTDEDTESEKYKRFIEKKYGRHFASDKDFHRWSVDNFEDHWGSIWEYFDIIASKPYTKVFEKTGPGFTDVEWFTDAKLNYAENLLRYRDDTMALKYEDELGNTDSLTFAEMYEQVRIYAAAFRKYGLKKGDTVACLMPNRIEDILAMLSVISIGAIWGGVIPYLGVEATISIICRIEPKMLITVERFQADGKQYDLINSLSTIAEKATSIEKIIIVPSRIPTLSDDISHIKNSCFLHEFLKTAFQEDGKIPELVFEQLPASHPIFLCLTSGTTGQSKAPVHSARILPQALSTVSFVCDSKRGDVVFNDHPFGWNPKMIFATCLALGATYYLYDGYVSCMKNSRNFWDVISGSKTRSVHLPPIEIDKLEKRNIYPKSSLSFKYLKTFILAGSPVKTENIKYLYKFLPKTVFISSVYGSTEFFGHSTGVYLKSPVYAKEAQQPALGMDLRVYDDNGLDVIGEQGHIVVTNQVPFMMSFLWKDSDKSSLHSNYLSRFPGIWCISDIGLINPVTNGVLVQGRTDSKFVQNGLRFGPEEIYHAIHNMEEISDYICVAQNKEEKEVRVVLFVKLKEGYEFTNVLKSKIEQRIESELFHECVPKVILPVKDIPHNTTGKRMESTVRKILLTNKVPEVTNIKNPGCLEFFCNIPEIMDY